MKNNNLKTKIIMVFAITWLLLNIWAYLRVHDISNITMVIMKVVVIANPFIVGWLSWYGWTKNNIYIKIWPLFMLLSWVFVPPLSSIYWFGYKSFINIMLWNFKCLPIIYYVICITVYIIMMILAKKRNMKIVRSNIKNPPNYKDTMHNSES